MTRSLTLGVGVVAVLLSGLWFLQGLGAVHMRPILCVADCAPVLGPSTAWAVIGSVVLLTGGGAVFWSLRRPNK